jgi:hypothetical protein
MLDPNSKGNDDSLLESLRLGRNRLRRTNLHIDKLDILLLRDIRGIPQALGPIDIESDETSGQLNRRDLAALIVVDANTHE